MIDESAPQVLPGSGELLRVPLRSVTRNESNPRLVFREDELIELQESIDHQGILVPLTVYKDGNRHVILDGERRWRCAKRLRLTHVPVIVQAKPAPMQNIMMMFAIHNAREDWDPLPSAIKLGDLEKFFEDQRGRPPREKELAELASMTVGEVRRLKQILDLPQHLKDELLVEIEKPKSEQLFTVDQVLETTRGLRALENRGVLSSQESSDLREAVVSKYKSKEIESTVDPRLLARLARSVERDEVEPRAIHDAVMRLAEPGVTIREVFDVAGRQSDTERQVELAANRLLSVLQVVNDELGGEVVLESARQALRDTRGAIDRVLER